MTSVNLEGTGASIAFATSQFASNLISLTLPEKTRAEMDTSHLGTSSAKTWKNAKLKDVGTIACEFDHNPDEVSLIEQEPEQITITYPLLPGQATAATLVFNGFVTQEGGEEFKIDTLLRTKATIRVNGDIEYTAATPALSS